MSVSQCWRPVRSTSIQGLSTLVRYLVATYVSVISKHWAVFSAAASGCYL